MRLRDIRDYIDSLGLSDHTYMGKMDHKMDKSIGVYNSKRTYEYSTAIGGPSLRSYGIKYMTLLVHWNKSPGETETAASALFEALERTREATINEQTIKFVQLLCSEPIDVGTDEAGIFEMVIEAAVVYQKGA